MKSSAKKTDRADLIWAEDVLEIHRLGSAAPPNDARPSLRELYDWSLNPENRTKLIVQLCPKATEIINKHSAPLDDAEIIRQERRSIAELQDFLREAVAESEKVC